MSKTCWIFKCVSFKTCAVLDDPQRCPCLRHLLGPSCGGKLSPKPLTCQCPQCSKLIRPCLRNTLRSTLLLWHSTFFYTFYAKNQASLDPKWKSKYWERMNERERWKKYPPLFALVGLCIVIMYGMDFDKPTFGIIWYSRNHKPTKPLTQNANWWPL